MIILNIFSQICFSEEEKEKVFDLGEIEIIGTRTPHLLKETPGIVTIITKEEIETKKILNFEDLFEFNYFPNPPRRWA